MFVKQIKSNAESYHRREPSQAYVAFVIMIEFGHGKAKINDV